MAYPSALLHFWTYPLSRGQGLEYVLHLGDLDTGPIDWDRSQRLGPFFDEFLGLTVVPIFSSDFTAFGLFGHKEQSVLP